MRNRAMAKGRAAFMLNIGRASVVMTLFAGQTVLSAWFSLLIAQEMGPVALITINDYSISLIQYGFAAFFTLLFAPMSLGVAEYFLRVVRDQRPKVMDIFAWYGDMAKLWHSLGFGVVMAVIGIVFSALSEIPSYFLRSAPEVPLDLVMTEQFFDSYFAWIRGSILPSLGLLALQIPMVFFAAYSYWMAERQGIGAWHGLKESVALMRSHFGSFLLLLLRLLPWLLLLVTFCGFFIITIIFVLAYIECVITAYINMLIFGTYIHFEGPSPGDPPSET